jgi:putative RNA 2'-phosphotransferase
MVSSKQHNKTSKFLSFVLRHKPEAIDLELNTNGWANLDELIDKANAYGEVKNLDRALIREVVDTNDKKRFIISDDGQQIRANQGHSADVDLQLKPVKPPAILYHGTATRFLDSILAEGLKPGKRHHVHLSTDIATANSVGKRYGKPVIFKIYSESMFKQGYVFFLSDNNVWLTSNVPPQFLSTENQQPPA